MKHHITKYLFIFVVALSVSACRKDLCYDHDMHSFGYRLDIAPQWECEWERPYEYDWNSNWEGLGLDYSYDDLRPEPATGIAAILYKKDETGALKNAGEYHLPADGGHLITDEATSALLFYNDDSEYIIFNNMATVSQASATTRTRSRASFAALHASERTVNPPDILYGHFVADHKPVYAQGYTPLDVKMQPLVYTYVIRYIIQSGAQYVSLARGAIAGMAETVMLHDGSTPANRATILFDCELTPYGVEAKLLSFGVPNFPDSYYGRADGDDELDDSHYALNLELRLVNGKIVSYEFDISDQMRDQPRGGVITIDNIVVSDEDGKSGGSFFEATVEGWGPYEDVDLF